MTTVGSPIYMAPGECYKYLLFLFFFDYLFFLFFILFDLFSLFFFFSFLFSFFPLQKKKEIIATRKYTEIADCYSYAVLLCDLFGSYPPFSEVCHSPSLFLLVVGVVMVDHGVMFLISC